MRKQKILLIFFLILSQFIPLIINVYADTYSGDSRLYWYNPIEETEDIYISGTGVPSVDYVNMYGNYSVRIDTIGSNDIYTATQDCDNDLLVYTNDTAGNGLTFGMWIYVNQTNAFGNNAIIKWLCNNDESTNDTQVAFLNKYNGSDYTIQKSYQDPETVLWYEDTGLLTSTLVGNWHWFEISIYSDGTRDFPSDDPTFVMYIDGNSYGLMYGTGTPNSIHLTQFDSVVYARALSVSSGYIEFDFARFYQGEQYPPSYPPESSGGFGEGVDWSSLHAKLGLRLNISPFIAGLMISLFLLILIELPFLIFATDSIFMQACIGIAVLGFCTVLSWLPPFTYVLITIMTVLLFVDVIRKKVFH